MWGVLNGISAILQNISGKGMSRTDAFQNPPVPTNLKSHPSSPLPTPLPPEKKSKLSFDS